MVDELKRITYVEDEPDIREVARIGLETLGGFDVDVCADGAEAVARAPTFGPDLILLDVMMPGMDGIETYQALRKVSRLQNTPIVFMTAKAQPSEVERYTALGCAGVIVKPFDPVTLPEQVRSIWIGRQRSCSVTGTDQLRSILTRHCASLPEEIESAAATFAEAVLRRESFNALTCKVIEIVHKINGSSGSLGFGRLSVAARQFEDALIESTAAEAEPDEGKNPGTLRLAGRDEGYCRKNGAGRFKSVPIGHLSTQTQQRDLVTQIKCHPVFGPDTGWQTSKDIPKMMPAHISKKLFSDMAAVALAALCLVGMNFSQAHAAQTGNQPPILIGLDAAMSGEIGQSGDAIRRGAQIAIQEINQSGGVLGRAARTGDQGSSWNSGAGR